MNEEVKLKSCPFCGGDRLVRSVNGGMLPSYIDQDQAMDIYENTPNVITCMLQCSICGAQVEGYAASNKCIDDLYEKAIENCYTKWNRRANDADVEPKRKWISVNQDKPKKDGKYFVLRHSQGRQIVEIMYYGIPEYLKDRYFYYNDSEWGDIVVVDITHWLPLSALPELPKGENDAEVH